MKFIEIIEKPNVSIEIIKLICNVSKYNFNKLLIFVLLVQKTLGKCD